MPTIQEIRVNHLAELKKDSDMKRDRVIKAEKQDRCQELTNAFREAYTDARETYIRYRDK